PNLGAAVGAAKLCAHVRPMSWGTIPALLIRAILFWFIGVSISSNSTADTSHLEALMGGLDEQFVIQPWLLLVPVLALSLMLFKMPALPTLLLVSLMGAATALLVQGSSVTDIL